MDIEEMKRKKDVEGLIKALKDEEIEVRATAAEALGEIGDARAVESLVQYLSDKQLDIGEEAAEALGKIGDVRAVEPLIQALSFEDSSTRAFAAEALGEIGDAKAVEPLIQALSFEDSSTRAFAAEALGKIGDARVKKPLEQALSDENPHVQKTASKALEKMGYAKRGKNIIRHLLILLEEEPVPEGVDGALSNVLDSAPYEEAGSFVYRGFVDDKTKIKVAVTGPKDYSKAYIVASARTHFPEIDANNLRHQKFLRVDQQGKQSRGIIIHD